MKLPVHKQNLHKHTETELDLFGQYAAYFEDSPLSTTQKLQSFCKYVRRQDLSRFLAKNEVFKQQLNVPGSIIECGTYAGQGLMTFAQLSSIYEPNNHTRKIIGFDTFKGMPKPSKKKDKYFKKGDLKTHKNIVGEIKHGIGLHDMNRTLGHITKTEVITGDVNLTIPRYVEINPHLVVSLLYLDFDLYKPTMKAIDELLHRIPSGGVIAFDELNAQNCGGETQAVIETIGLNNLKLKRTQFDPWITYAKIR